MINKLILTLVVLFIGLQSQTQSISENYDLRPIDEINLNDHSDAYPWISDDGLRLYFCGNESGKDLSSIYLASRKDSDDPFDEPEVLSINIPGTDNYSPFLSKDELTLTFAARIPDGLISTSIYMATRDQKKEAFSQAIKIELTGKIRGDLISPSFTPDLSELYLFNEYKNHQAIIKLVRINNNTYQLVN
ncbi:MAG: PD40 domain-containing protein, partial [Bacteroidia bacterium]|nr:PD40 domain-containing protein [Bacteroidia bacterium]